MQKNLALLRILADGYFHSGQRLAEEQGVSRTAIWKNIRQLKSLGLEINAVTGKGYRLAEGIELLDADLIRTSIAPEQRQQLTLLEVLPVVDSTSEYLKRKALTGLSHGLVCTAEYQTQGRGRNGRLWVSPFGAGLYLSLAWEMARPLESLLGLTPACGVALTRALAQLGLNDIQLKWPNDLIADGKKLGGVLVETTGEMGSDHCRMIIGIGINVRYPEDLPAPIDQPWTSLIDGGHRDLSRNRLAGAVITQLFIALAGYQQQGFSAFAHEWQRLDLVKDKRVTLERMDKTITGIAKGVDKDGALLIKTNGRIQRHVTGELNLRLSP